MHDLLESFPDTSRFDRVRRLGAGGMGVVFEAHDRERRHRVALKTVRVPDAAAIYRLKNEFRALSGIVHPNLVTLYELVAEPGSLFFTMELVDGVDLVTFVRGTPQPLEYASTAESEGHLDRPRVTREQVAEVAPTQGLDPLAIERLRSSLRQVAEGMLALHAMGKLHRDLKPSNVIVTPQGRAVILDFGLVVEASGTMATQRDAVAGTIEYMAPEQAASMDLSEATDWYAVGVMLYEALTGELPYRGTPLQVMMDKQRLDPVRPRERIGGVPLELDELCMDLLARDPERRPSGRRTIERLGGPARTVASSSHSSTSLHGAQPFVGRRREMNVIRAALAECNQQRAVMVYVHGGSGLGKSALVRRVLEELQQSEGALVLTGRCYEQESVPYKAIDSVIDALSHTLKALPRAQAAALLPREIQALARIFPVLRRVEAVVAAPRRPEIPDPQELRRRAFGALRELLTRLADRWPLVIWIDDLQWGDEDSAALLGELLRPPDQPPMLLIASYRSEGAAQSAPLAALHRARERHGADAPVYELALQPFTLEETRELVTRLLPGRADLAATVAREAAGNPFLMTELVQYAQNDAELRRSQSGQRLRFDLMLDDRLERLPPQVRVLLEVVAVAGRPVSREAAIAAAEIAPRDERSAIGLLRAGRLVRSSRSHDVEELDSFHDRIRETAVSLLGPEALRLRHERLFWAMQATSAPDAEALSIHALGAGETERAGEWAERAGDNAAESLAFDRAAAWYGKALAWQRPDAAHARGLYRKRGDAASNAGRGGEAAADFLLAVKGAPAAEGLDLRRNAAQQYLTSGHIAEGISTLTDVLESVGLGFPRSSRAALWEILRCRLRLAVFGHGFTERDSREIPVLTQQRMDACWTATVGLVMSDLILAHCFQYRLMLMALDSGDPLRIGRALAAAVWGMGAEEGARRSTRSIAILEKARELTERLGDVNLSSLLLLTNGLGEYFRGNLGAALELLDDAATSLRQQCLGVAWELDTAANFSLSALWSLGRIREFTRRAPPLLEEAIQRGDLYLQSILSIGYPNGRWLVADDPARALKEIDEAMTRTSTRAIHAYYVLLARTQAELYSAQAEVAYRGVKRDWPALEKSFMLRTVLVRVWALHLRARAALAAACVRPDGAKLRREALRDARVLEARALPFATALATSIRATVAAQEGDRARAARLFETAAGGFEANSMRLYAAAARHRQGEMVPDARGQAHVADALEYMRIEEIRNPPRMIEMLMPGVPTAAPQLAAAPSASSVAPAGARPRSSASDER